MFYYEHMYYEVSSVYINTGVIANCVMLDNTIEISAALNALAKEGCLLLLIFVLTRWILRGYTPDKSSYPFLGDR